MTKKYVREHVKRTVRPLYWIVILLIIVFWFYAFKQYFMHYDMLHPDVVWAAPCIERDLLSVKGVLLWDEDIINAPVSGRVSYPMGRGPVRVTRGMTVAIVGGRAVKAPQQGYFIAGRDGVEGKWKYSLIWTDDAMLSKKTELKYFDESSGVLRGTAVGKLIVQPQELRFIAVVPKRGDVAEQAAKKRLKVRLDKDDTVSTAKIRVTMAHDDKIKMYVTMPWFPEQLAMSRNYNLIIDAGETKGCAIPKSALTEKDGARGVLLVRGARVVFTKVNGKNMADGRFIVTDGISPGDVVVEKAAESREGRIQLW